MVRISPYNSVHVCMCEYVVCMFMLVQNCVQCVCPGKCMNEHKPHLCFHSVASKLKITVCEFVCGHHVSVYLFI